MVELTDPLRLVIGIVFLVASASKLTTIRKFCRGLAEVYGLPSKLAPLAATSIIGAELSVSYWHLNGVPSADEVALSMLLIGIFIVVLIARKQHAGGGEASCLCFGAATRTGSPSQSLVILGLMLAGEIELSLSPAGVAFLQLDLRQGMNVVLNAVILSLAGFWLSLAPQLFALLRSAKATEPVMPANRNSAHGSMRASTQGESVRGSIRT